MKYFISTLLVICLPIFVFSQDITGLWKGTMFNDSTQQSIEYEIVISKNKGKYTGFSHTWFLIDEKKYYGVKKINVRIAKDGKVILQDAELIDNNYPVLPYKDVLQLNVLDLANPGDEARLDGLFVTNRTKYHKEITGHISVKRVSQYSQSDLLSYLEKNSRDIYFAAVK